MRVAEVAVETEVLTLWADREVERPEL